MGFLHTSFLSDILQLHVCELATSSILNLASENLGSDPAVVSGQSCGMDKSIPCSGT